MTVFILTIAIIVYIEAFIIDIIKKSNEYDKLRLLTMLIIAICLQYLYNSN